MVKTDPTTADLEEVKNLVKGLACVARETDSDDVLTIVNSAAGWLVQLAEGVERLREECDGIDALEVEVRRLREALGGLSKEVEGMLGAFHRELIEVVSITNVRCVEHRLEIARAALKEKKGA